VNPQYSDYVEGWISFRGNTTILGGAAKSGSLEIIELILQACPGIINPEGMCRLEPYFSPLTMAIGTEKTHCIEPLILAGVDMEVTNDPFTLVEYALIQRNLEAVQILITYGASIDRPFTGRKLRSLALLWAIFLGYDKAVQNLGHTPHQPRSTN
jgi:hypothetical protein